MSVPGKIIWALILLAHGTVAGLWWWAMPGGFPWPHPRFWANEVLPLAAGAVAVIGLCGLASMPRLAQGPILAIPAFWTAATVAATIAFPISRGRFLAPLVLVVAVAWFAYWFWPVPRRPVGLWTFIVLIAAMAAGAAASWTQRAPEASTAPLNGAFAAGTVPETRPKRELLQLSDRLAVDTASGTTFVQCGLLSIKINPLLTFISCSPDRCWTSLAPPGQRVLPGRALRGVDLADGRATLTFAGDPRHLLRVQSANAAGDCTIEALAQLDRPIYSHLNSFCHLTISGHRRLALGFSPCPGLRVDVEPSDYPIGRPERFAFVDAQARFHVVEASSGEKGPYKVLGRGLLPADKSLKLDLYDDSRLIASISFGDWATQSSTELSPTAGWGVPMNAIEFRRLGEAPQAPAGVWITLAGTSVGRGWDSVGHRAGTYRNQIQVETKFNGAAK